MALPHTTNILYYPARYQFGQYGAPCGGSSCCTDTCIQMIVEYYKERTYSLSTIRYHAQALTNYNEAPCTGINHIEARNALKRLGVSHYQLATGISSSFVYSKLRYGPVLVGVWYGSYPNRSGSGRPNQAEYEGRDDWGFSGAHAVLVVKSRYHTNHTDFYVRDPDHNSPSRPRKPRYDIIRSSQLSKTMLDLPRYSAFSQSFCLYPTQKKIITTVTTPPKYRANVIGKTAIYDGNGKFVMYVSGFAVDISYRKLIGGKWAYRIHEGKYIGRYFITGIGKTVKITEL